MFFRKNIHEKIADIAAQVQLKEDEFLKIPGLNCSMASDRLKYKDGRAVGLDFAEAQLLTRELSKDYGLDVRLPSIKEDYIAFQTLGRCSEHSSEWKAEYLDGSFLMRNPDVRIVSHPRKYDFNGNFVSLIEISRYTGVKDNGSLYWLGISKDSYDRAAFVNSFSDGRHFLGAISPLSRDCLGVRLLIDGSK